MLISRVVICPYCFQEVEVSVDPGGGVNQEYVEDCEVCCRPWLVNVYVSGTSCTVAVARSQ